MASGWAGRGGWVDATAHHASSISWVRMGPHGGTICCWDHVVLLSCEVKRVYCRTVYLARSRPESTQAS